VNQKVINANPNTDLVFHAPVIGLEKSIVLNAKENSPMYGSINKNNTATIPAVTMGVSACIAAEPASALQKMAVVERLVIKLPI